MKTNTPLPIVLLILISACASNPTAGPTMDVPASQTLAYETAIAETQRAIPWNTLNSPPTFSAPTVRPSSTPEPRPTHTPLPELPPNAIDLQWITAYGLPGDQSATKIYPTKDGGVILVGGELSSAFLLKLRADGFIEWQKSLPQVSALDGLETSTGDFILEGDRHWIKFDSQGHIFWQYPFEGASYHTGPILRLVEESNRNILVEAAGSRAVFNADGELQSFTEHTMPSDSQMSPGAVIDRFRLDENQFNNVFFVQMTADGGALVGNIAYEDLGDVANWLSNAEISRISGDGSLRWQGVCCSYLGASYEDFHAFETKSGDIIVAGTLNYFADQADRNGVLMFRLDGDGKRRWDKLYATEGQDAVAVIQELSNGDLIFAGQTSGARTGGQDMWVLKTNAQGEIPNCGHMSDSWGGTMVDLSEVETTTPEPEQWPYDDAAQAIPLCSPSP
jgi:hypothetical protein